MQITIDTKHDKPEEIKKAIMLLQRLIEGNETHSNIFENSTPTENSNNEGGIFGNMFGSTETPSTPEEPKEESEEKKEEVPSIMSY